MAGITIFDVLAPVCIAVLLLASPADKTISDDRDLRLIAESQLFFVIASIASAIPSAAVGEHIAKCIVIAIAMIAMFVMASLIVRKCILSFNEAAFWLALSAGISSAFVILQGQFRLFTSISPVFNTGTQEWLRATGLAEHPIEAGAIAGIGMVLALHLLLARRVARHPFTAGVLLAAIFVDAYSMISSASLTAVGSVAAALAAQLVLARRYGLLMATIAAIPAIVLPYLLASSSLLGDRLLQLLTLGDRFTTVQSRQSQLSETLGQIDFASFILGHGYSFNDLPQGLEIHNAALASLYHFGVLGLISQICICAYLLRKVISPYPAPMRGALLGVLLVFFGEYLTGPVFARRSDWITVIVLASFMPSATSRRNQRLRDPGVSSFGYYPKTIDVSAEAQGRPYRDGAGTCES
ncbi:hypothetical protein [Bradyrhizobium nitroreducens]|uniref:hypothetical protein n=1 Tax=Bradyrhizobium nitroreducens TaxID=709803 RepID=UPI0011AE8E8A|nr:hypothetical protein [Bradyrhizobium nitroreducens]